MSDTDFVDVGDELVVRISGYPVGKAVVECIGEQVIVIVTNEFGEEMQFNLPLDFKDYEKIDGYGHHTQPLEG